MATATEDTASPLAQLAQLAQPRPLTVSRAFNAPKELVFQAWP